MESQYLLERRAAMLKGVKTESTQNKKSPDQKDIDRELKKLYPPFLLKHPLCEIHGPHCLGVATCAHHSEGRLPSIVLDMTKWIPSCAPCNLWAETHDKEARASGAKKSRLGKPVKKSKIKSTKKHGKEKRPARKRS